MLLPQAAEFDITDIFARDKDFTFPDVVKAME